MEDDYKLLGSLLDDCLKGWGRAVSEGQANMPSPMLASPPLHCPDLHLYALFNPKTGSTRQQQQTVSALTAPDAVQVERICSLAHCASDLSKKHDEVSLQMAAHPVKAWL